MHLLHLQLPRGSSRIPGSNPCSRYQIPRSAVTLRTGTSCELSFYLIVVLRRHRHFCLPRRSKPKVVKRLSQCLRMLLATQADNRVSRNPKPPNSSLLLIPKNDSSFQVNTSQHNQPCQSWHGFTLHSFNNPARTPHNPRPRHPSFRICLPKPNRILDPSIRRLCLTICNLHLARPYLITTYQTRSFGRCCAKSLSTNQTITFTVTSPRPRLQQRKSYVALTSSTFVDLSQQYISCFSFYTSQATSLQSASQERPSSWTFSYFSSSLS